MSNWYQSAEARAVHRDLRRMKGRPPGNTYYVVYNEKGRRVMTVHDDPIFHLRSAREFRHRFPARYGEIRQRVVSPVTLPDLREQS